MRPTAGRSPAGRRGGDARVPARPRRVFTFVLSVPFFPFLLSAQDRDDPAAELSSFTMADGFEANLFASEKDGVVKPIQIRFDARGRLWVIGSAVYPQLAPGQSPDDKVLILEDTDGDGRSDKTTVFADDLLIPTGLETFADGSGCYVGHGTELLLLKDHDGDGRSDARQVVLRGFGTGDNHQNINSFAWGPTGELWFCQGLHSHARVETPFGVVKLDQAGIWRLNTRTLKLEGFYGSAVEPQNPWGFVFTDWGEPIELAGNNHSIIYPVPGLVKHPKPAPPTLIWPTGRVRKMSGGEIVGTAHFPDAWQGRLIVGGYINNAIWTMTIHDDGAGFLLKDAEPLITSTHGSFRPVDVKFGPDGALYVCDWYNPIIGHYQASFRHPDRDKTHGRIWRVTAKGRKLSPARGLPGKTVPELAAHLTVPDRWVRYFARRLLVEHESRDRVREEMRHDPRNAPAFPVKGDQVSEVPASRQELGAVERIGVLASRSQQERAELASLAASRNPALRAFAASVSARVAGQEPVTDILKQLATHAVDPHPRVRLHAIVACTHVDTAEAVEVALMAADEPTDKFIDYALGQAVFSLKPKWLGAFQAGRLTFEAKPARLSAFVRADGTADTLVALRGLANGPGLDGETRRAFRTILAETGDANDLAALLALDDTALADVMPAAVRAAQRRGLRPDGDLVALTRSLLARTDPAVRDGALRLAGVWKLVELRRELLARAGSSAAALEGLLSLDLAAGAATAAQALAASADGAVAPVLLPAFFERGGAPEALVKALDAAVPTPTAAAAALRVLRERGLESSALTARLASIAGLPPPRWIYSPAFAEELSAEVRAKGNAANGRVVYRRPELTCTACHSVAGEGGKIGPALDAIGSAQPLDFIIGAVLAPQKEVKESYEAVQVTSKAGEVIVGHHAGASDTGWTLRDPGTGEFMRVPREAIAAEKALGSLMPAGLVDPLSRDELRDLIRFLSELGKPPNSSESLRGTDSDR